MTNHLVTYTLSTTTASYALYLAGNDTLFVSRSGVVAGLAPAGDAVFMDSNAMVINHGAIHGAATGLRGIYGYGQRQIYNAEGGLISSDGLAITLDDAPNTLIENDGNIFGAAMGIRLTDSVAYIRNGGTISGGSIGISAVDESCRISNSGEIRGTYAAVEALDNGNRIVNDGLITSDLYGLLVGVSGTTVVNTGTIRAVGYGGSAIAFSGSTDAFIVDNVIENEGLILAVGDYAYAMLTSGTRDLVRNAGEIVGRTQLRAGDDLFDGTEGRQGLVIGWEGNDTLLGGAGADHFTGDADADSLAGGAGDDTLSGGAGADTLEGGDGRDLLDYRGSGAVEVNLATGTGSGGHAAGDVISGFEWVAGGDGADTLAGDAGDNRLLGGAGLDVLNGAAGNDTLVGGDGDDFLTGGAGTDVLTGGLDADRFRFTAVTDSAGSARDVITDFAAGDRVDLLFVDANATGGTANDTFAFVGTAAFTAAGQVRAEVVGSNTTVHANTDANLATSEMVIVLRGATILTASDFVL